MSNYDKIETALKDRESSTIDLSHCGFDTVDAGVLSARLFTVGKNIKTILLNNNQIDDQWIGMLAESLKECKNITLVDFSDNPFGDRGLVALAGLKKDRPDMTIRGIDLSQEQVNEAQLQLYAKSKGFRIPQGKRLKLVDDERPNLRARVSASLAIDNNRHDR